MLVDFAFFSLHLFLEPEQSIDCLFVSNFFYMFFPFSLLLPMFSLFLCLVLPSAFSHSCSSLLFGSSFSITVTLFHCHVMLGSLLSPFSEPISCISGSPDNEAEVRTTLSAAVHISYPDTNSQMSTWRLVVFPSFVFIFDSPLAFALSSLPLPLFSLSTADLWDQPSKTDSHFFTDHECVSGYATEMKRENERNRVREKERTCEYVTNIFVDLCLHC